METFSAAKYRTKNLKKKKKLIAGREQTKQCQHDHFVAHFILIVVVVRPATGLCHFTQNDVANVMYIYTFVFITFIFDVSCVSCARSALISNCFRIYNMCDDTQTKLTAIYPTCYPSVFALYYADSICRFGKILLQQSYERRMTTPNHLPFADLACAIHSQFNLVYIWSQQQRAFYVRVSYVKADRTN